MANTNVLYKIISRILVSRLRPYLNDIISLYQNAFVPKRHIQDNVLLTHELFHTMHKSKNKNGILALKIDLLKTYDQVESPFLHRVLEQHNLPMHFIKYTMECQYKVIVKGSVFDNIWPTRGLRRGDPPVALSIYFMS